MTERDASRCPNVALDGEVLYTKNLIPGNTVYGERLVRRNGIEMREWDPGRSKLAAYLLLSGDGCELNREDIVLYLGAASGTTVSHVSDIADRGQVYAIEISKRSFRDLMRNCGPRANVVPVLGDARDGSLLAGMITHADFLYVDVAQRDQVRIFLNNFSRYGCRNGLLMLKCRSIDVAADPPDVAKASVGEIEASGLRCDEALDIGRYEKDHYAIAVRKG